jgi:hypothetical protein
MTIPVLWIRSAEAECQAHGAAWPDSMSHDQKCQNSSLNE